MKILVTGATGFIGSAFAKLAVARGHEVGGMMLPTESPPAHVPVSDRMVWIRGVLANLPWEKIEAFRPEACVHFAWIATPGVYLESPENERHLEWSLDLARRLKGIGVRQFVGAGTCIEYQITDAPLNEDRTPVNPTTLYARCKNALRETLEAEAIRDGSHFAWGRVFYPYGVGEHPARLCSSIIQKLGRDEKILLKTPHSTKDYIYITDLAAAFLAVIEKRFRGTINLGTGAGVSVREIALRLATLMDKPGLIEEANPPQPDPFPFVVADAGKLKSLGWQPAMGLKNGLARLVEAVRA
jgi:nucleoside-diphosphate-sugar epimerase